jgi:hypothetical protein
MKGTAMPGNIEMKIADVKASTKIAGHTAAIHRLVKHTRAGISAIGRHLAAVRDLLDHGDWLTWLNTEFAWSDQTARRLIHVFELSQDGKFNTVLNLDLPLGVLYQLAAPKAEAARTEVAELIDNGKKPSKTEVQEILARHRTATKAEPAEVETTDVVVLRDWKTGIETVVPTDADPDHADDADGQAMREFFAADPAKVATKMVAIVGPETARLIINELEVLLPLKATKAATSKPFKSINLHSDEFREVSPRDNRFRQ